MKTIRWILLSFLMASCLGQGTDTGNPGYNCGAYTCTAMSGDNSSKVIAMESLIYNLCLVIKDCKSQVVDTCRSRLRQQTNLIAKVGLSDVDFASAQAVIDAEEDGLLDFDTDQLDTCLLDTRALQCDDTGVDDTYDPGLTNPYEKTADIVPASCSTIFN